MTTLCIGGSTRDQPPGTSGLAQVLWTPQGFGDVRRVDGPEDPTWLVRVDADVLYAVGAGDPGPVARVRLGDGVVASASSGVPDPVHLARSGDGRWLVAASYVGGSVGLLAVGADGGLSHVDVLAFEGDGPHERQDAPHAHQAVFLDDTRLLVCDLGADRVREVTCGESGLRHTGDVTLPPGTGPRHLALAPGRDDLIWVVGELDQSVHTLRRGTGGWTVTQTVSTTPEGPGPGETTTAGIAVAPDGAHVYVSTRGTDTVSVLAVADDGTLAPLHRLAAGAGGTPAGGGGREGGSVDVWAVDEGLLEETGHSLAWSAPTWAG